MGVVAGRGISSGALVTVRPEAAPFGTDQSRIGCKVRHHVPTSGALPMPGLVTVRFPDVSGIPADDTQLQFVFDNDPAASGTDMISAVNRFINVVAPGATNSVGAYIAASRSRAALALKFEAFQLAGHLDGTPHGSPVLTEVGTLVAPINSGLLPDQLAAVLSYHSDLTGILERGPTHTVASDDKAVDEGAPATHPARSRPKASRRGRIWVGPLGTFTLGDTEGSGIKAVVLTDLCKAAADLVTTTVAGNIPWSVWSRIGAGAVNHVIGGWCDQRFATQRRRRDKATERSLWP
jgi:hypothetical protein